MIFSFVFIVQCKMSPCIGGRCCGEIICEVHAVPVEENAVRYDEVNHCLGKCKNCVLSRERKVSHMSSICRLKWNNNKLF